MRSSLTSCNSNLKISASNAFVLIKSVKRNKLMKMSFERSLLIVAFAMFFGFSMNAQLSTVTITSPDDVAGDYIAQLSAFGPQDSGTITGTGTFIDDGVEVSTNGCESPIGDMTGLVAFIDRGDCAFVDKVVGAQDAGAIAAVVCNNNDADGEELVLMGPEDAEGINIPSVFLSYNSCQIIRTAAEGGTVDMRIHDGTDDGGGNTGGGEGEGEGEEECDAGNISVCGDVTGQSTLTFDMDACLALSDGSNTDFSEFTATLENEGDCANMTVMGGNLYTDNPGGNMHSCTPGVMGNGMCTGAQESCEFTPSSDHAVYIDVVVEPGAEGVASLSGLSFYEQAPISYNWNQGQVGPNNYPTLYAVRVIRDGEMIYGEFDIPTNRNWSLAEYNFSGSEFAVSEATLFTVELTAYCAIGNGVLYSIWDLDEISITSTCASFVSGGTITTDHGNEIDICAGDGNPDVINAEVCGNTGDYGAWVVTDPNGNIIALPPTGSVDFEGAGTGICYLWYVSSDEPIVVSIGMNVSELETCHALSNPVIVNRIGVKKSGITLQDGSTVGTVCATGSGVGEVINILSASGSGTFGCQIVVTDVNNVITDIPSGDVVIGGENGTCLIYEVCTSGDFVGQVGMVLDASGSMATECYGISNSITITKSVVNAATLTLSDGSTSATVCTGDGLSDALSFIQSGGSGSGGVYVVTDTDGNILSFGSSSTIEFDRGEAGSCLVWYVTYDGDVAGLVEGANAADLSGCFALSNPVTITKNATTVAGTIIFSDGTYNQEVCSGDGISDPLTVITSTGSGSGCELVITDPNGNIISIPGSNTIDFEGAGSGVCYIYEVCTSATGSGSGFSIGENISNTGSGSCASISNALSVVRNSTTTPTITTGTGATSISLCVGDNSSDSFDVILSNGTSDGAWVITDENGIILELPAGPPFDFDGVPPGTCLIWYLNNASTTDGVFVGADATTFGSCAGLSNPITVIRYQGSAASSLTFSDGSTSANICAGDGSADFLTIISNSGSGSASSCTLVITDANGNVLDFPSSNTIDFDGAGLGTCNIYEVCHSGSFVGNIGDHITTISNSNVCSGTSNALTVVRSTGTAPTLTTSFGSTSISICAGNNNSDAFDVILSNGGSDGSYVVTDVNGTVLNIPVGPPFDFDTYPIGTCLLWYLNGASGFTIAPGTSIFSYGSTCSGLSNSITVTKLAGVEGSGGSIVLSTGLLKDFFCVTDGQPDLATVISTNTSGSCQLVVTNFDGYIVALPTSNTIDFEGAEGGVCYIYEICVGNPSDVMIGQHINMWTGGCNYVSNRIVISRIIDCSDMGGGGGGECTAEAGAISISPSGATSTSICVGDGVSDALDITVSGNVGEGGLWLVTDADGNILDLPASGNVDFEGAGAGTCLVWYLSYEGVINGVTVGQNASGIMGCFDLSNPVTVERIDVTPSSITLADGTTTGSVCVDDDLPDNLTVISSSGSGSGCVTIITDVMGNILETVSGSGTGDLDFTNAGVGVCLVYEACGTGSFTGSAGDNINTTPLFDGCYGVSNAITVTRTNCGDGGGGSGEDCVCYEGGLFNATVTVTGQDAGIGWDDCDGVTWTGSVEWIEDEDNPGTYISYSTGPDGNFLNDMSMGAYYACYENDGDQDALPLGDLRIVWDCNTFEIVGASQWGEIYSVTDIVIEGNTLSFSWTNDYGEGAMVTLVRKDGNEWIDDSCNDSGGGEGSCEAEGGSIVLDKDGSTSMTICASDGLPEQLGVDLEGASGSNSAWVVTDENGVILSVNAGPPFNFEGSQPGVCLIWHLSYEDDLTGADVGANASGLGGCYDLSNPITIIHTEYWPSEITFANGTTTTNVCLEDATPDVLNVTSDTGSGTTDCYLLLVDDNNDIISIDEGLSMLIEGATTGTCSIYEVCGTGSFLASPGDYFWNGALFTGCYGVSNQLTVVKTCNFLCEPEGGSLFAESGGSNMSLCISNDVAPSFNVNLADLEGSNQAWIITDANGNIIDMPAGPPFNTGHLANDTYRLYNVSYEDDLSGMEIDGNIANFAGCFDLSNPLTIEAYRLAGGELVTADGEVELDMCAADGISSLVDVEIADKKGENSSWLITNAIGEILHANIHPPFSFDGMNAGVYMIWHVSYEDGMTGMEVGKNASEFSGCHDLSNPITVFRSEVVGGQVAIAEGKTIHEVCLNDDQDDIISVNTNGTIGFNYLYLVATEDGEILDILTSNTIDVSEYGNGMHLIYGVSYTGNLLIEKGDDINEAIISDECFDLSDNAVQVTGDDSGIICGSIEEPSDEIDFAVYPNPATDFVMVEVYSVPDLEDTRIEVYDAAGQLVTSRTLNVTQSNLERVDILDYSDGYYFIKLVSSNAVDTESFIITR